MSVATAAATLRLRSSWAGPAPEGSGPALILISGLPGTGKSHLAAAIARRHPVAVVRSDEVRKGLFRRPAYTPAESGFVYLTCYALLGQLLADGYAVVFDATNLSRSGRQRARAIAGRAGAPAVMVVAVAPPEVVAQRLAERAAGQGETFASDADWAVYQKLAPSAEPEGQPGLVVDTSQDIGPAIERAIRFLSEAARASHASQASPPPPNRHPATLVHGRACPSEVAAP